MAGVAYKYWDRYSERIQGALAGVSTGPKGPGEERSIVFSPFEGGSDASLGHPAAADQISHGGNSGTTRQPPRPATPGGSLGARLPLSSCAIFPPQQTFPSDKRKASLKKKSGKNECSKARADTTSLARGDTLSPGHRLEEGGLPRRPCGAN